MRPVPDAFDDTDLKAMVNADSSVNLDPEGIAVASTGGFWVASKGSGTVGDAAYPVKTANLIFKLSASGVIEDIIATACRCQRQTNALWV
jgi:hypothetical protein